MRVTRALPALICSCVSPVWVDGIAGPLCRIESRCAVSVSWLAGRGMMA